MKQNKTFYDLILLCSHFRTHNFHLNVIKTLSQEIKIGILPVDVDRPNLNAARERTTETNDLFVDMCAQMGADVIKNKVQYSCNLLLAPQYEYRQDTFENIDYNKLIILHRLGSGSFGISQLKDYGAQKILVYEKKLFLEMFATENKDFLLADLEIVEMGSPFKKYPAFDFTDLRIDYLIAYPTPMLIRNSKVRLKLMQNIYNLIKNIPANKNICIKMHNVRDGGYAMGSSKAQLIGNFLRRLIDNLLALLTPIKPLLMRLSRYGDIDHVRAKIYDAHIMEKAIPLSSISPYYNLGIEHFLPFVKEALLTGLSGCIWHALYNRLPVYNCDAQPFTEAIPNYPVYKCFYINHTDGGLGFDEILFNKISDSAREADLIELIKNEIKRKEKK